MSQEPESPQRRRNGVLRQPFIVVALLACAAVLGPMVVPPAFEQVYRFVVLAACSIGLVVMLGRHRRSIRQALELAQPHDRDEAVLREGAAYFREGGIAAQGGVLVLTPSRLTFSAHGFGQRAFIRSWLLERFNHVELSRTFGLIPNSIRLRFEDAEFHLVLADRDAWTTAIRSAASERQSSAVRVQSPERKRKGK